VVAISKRHQTNAASFSVMSLPKIAVKPANTTATCNLMNAPRMLVKIGEVRLGNKNRSIANNNFKYK
jgi:hypothetical protein